MVFQCGCNICSIPTKILPGWHALLESEFEQEYFRSIISYLHKTQFYPKPEHVLRALTYFECAETKVVVLGQDPYHGPGQAVGLSFSVPVGERIPPSLINIRKEIVSSTGAKSVCNGGSLVPWAKQGVLLLNSILTVTQKQPHSHSQIGWTRLTDKIIEKVSEQSSGTVFMLWGKDAEKKKPLINSEKHLILCTTHPSPFSARKGFLGCQHFKRANEYLEKLGKDPINW